MVNKKLIDQALQQMIGFKLGKWSRDPVELASSMGLKEEEWEHIKKNEDSGDLEEEDTKEIDEYFENGGRY